MKVFAAGLCLLLSYFAQPARAGEAPTVADKVAIQKVIEGQLAAFMVDDQTVAFSFASPIIQRLFDNPENFMRMVRQGYPEVYRHGDVQFDKLDYLNGDLVQLVWLIGHNGKRRLAVYTMLRDAEGRWKINGCRLLDTGQVGA